MKISKKVVCLLTTLCILADGYCQVGNLYIDSVNAYVKYVDSLIVDYASNPVSETNIVKTGTHFSSLQKGNWCAQAELFKSNKDETIYRLSYADNCDSTFRLQDYYFSNNKIVFIRTVKSQDRKDISDQYYRDNEVVNFVKGELYLGKGYEIIEKMSN